MPTIYPLPDSYTTKLKPAQQGGKLRRIAVSYPVAVLAAGDQIELARVPQDSYLHRILIASDDLGGQAKLDVGLRCDHEALRDCFARQLSVGGSARPLTDIRFDRQAVTSLNQASADFFSQEHPVGSPITLYATATHASANIGHITCLIEYVTD